MATDEGGGERAVADRQEGAGVFVDLVGALRRREGLDVPNAVVDVAGVRQVDHVHVPDAPLDERVHIDDDVVAPRADARLDVERAVAAGRRRRR